MYFYLFDSFLNNKKYRQEINEIENRITELGIEGKYVHLTVLKNFEETLQRAINNQNFKTIVLVGNKRTLHQALNILKENPSPVLGYIPIEKNEKINQLLGIPPGKFAVDVLASRLIEEIDLGKVNNKYFLFSLEVGGDGLFLEGEDQNYQIIPQERENIIIGNLFKFNHHLTNPQDGFLEIIISPYTSKIWKIKRKGEKIEGLFYQKKIWIKAKGPSLPILIDDSEIIKTPAEVSILPKKIKMIVGREREF